MPAKKKDYKKASVNVSLYLSTEALAKLDKLVEDSQSNRSAIICRLIEEEAMRVEVSTIPGEEGDWRLEAFGDLDPWKKFEKPTSKVEQEIADFNAGMADYLKNTLLEG
jgi:hypothetical protein